MNEWHSTLSSQAQTGPWDPFDHRTLHVKTNPVRLVEKPNIFSNLGLDLLCIASMEKKKKKKRKKRKNQLGYLRSTLKKKKHFDSP